jgi:hypothetical protein
MGRWKIGTRIMLVIALVVAVNFAGAYLASLLNVRIAGSAILARWSILVLAVGYTAFLAIPFVPGAEIGIALMAMHGRAVALLVYLCTIAALSISFLAGRMIPLRMIAALCGYFHLVRAAEMLTEIEHLDVNARLSHLVSRAPVRAVPFMLRHRYVALAMALNLPGNSLIGGGGGIALIAGSTRLFSVAGFLIAVAIAVSPVPLAVYLFNVRILPF